MDLLMKRINPPHPVFGPMLALLPHDPGLVNELRRDGFAAESSIGSRRRDSHIGKPEPLPTIRLLTGGKLLW
jgi:hypothetical protein